MKNFPSIPHFHHPEVRDLAWAVGSTPLLADPDNKTRLHLLDDEWMKDRFFRHISWFEALDRDPEPLRQFLAQQDTQLVGKKFEALLNFWFEQSPWFDLIARSVQLIRDGKTIGEMDFIVKDRYSDEILHIEAACKYYYAARQSDNWKDWWGPNSTDRLELKMKKFQSQTALSSTKEGRRVLHEMGLDQVIPVVFLKGYLFYPFSALGQWPAPNLAHPKHNAGWYVSTTRLHVFEGDLAQWAILPKSHWIAPYHAENNALPLFTGDALEKELIENKALLVAQVANDAEQSRGLLLRSAEP